MPRAHLVESRWATCALSLESGWKLPKPVKLLTSFLDVQSVNPMLKTSLLEVPSGPVSPFELMGVSGQDKKTSWTYEDEKLAELISVATRKDREAFEVVDFGEPGALILSFCSKTWFDKRLDVGSVISSTVPFKIVLQRPLSILEKSPGLASR